jgi:hypothetical protein
MGSAAKRRLAVALVAPALILASGAHGMRLFSCATGGTSIHACCRGAGESAPARPTLSATRLHCCKAIALPRTEPFAPTGMSQAPSAPALALPAVPAVAPTQAQQPPAVQWAGAHGRDLPLRHRALLI